VSSDRFDVQYVAELARINLAPEEVATFQAQLEQVLTHVARLSEIDVAQVEPTAHSFPIFNVFRPDITTPCLDREVALSNAPRQAQDLFIVTKVLE
jgi:aspartyl-tRNA(Asn)/glutamyl-tRNA(Gln) amidotransferase subunit C